MVVYSVYILHCLVNPSYAMWVIYPEATPSNCFFLFFSAKLFRNVFFAGLTMILLLWNLLFLVKQNKKIQI